MEQLANDYPTLHFNPQPCQCTPKVREGCNTCSQVNIVKDKGHAEK